MAGEPYGISQVPDVPRVGITPWIEKWLIVLLLCNIVLGCIFIFYGSNKARDAADQSKRSHELLCEVVRLTAERDPQSASLRDAYEANC